MKFTKILNIFISNYQQQKNYTQMFTKIKFILEKLNLWVSVDLIA